MHPVQNHQLRIRRIEQPTSLEEALALLATEPDRSRVVAGGTDLLLEMQRGGRPQTDVLIDLNSIKELAGISGDGEWITIGGGVTHAEVLGSAVVGLQAAPLAQACAEIGSPQLRNRATVAGNLVTASPANDTITPLRGLDAALRLVSIRGERVVQLADFHTGVRRSVLNADELVAGIRFRRMGDDQRGIFVKLGNRRSQAISVVHSTIIVTFEGDIVSRCRILVGSVAPTIVELEAGSLLVGRHLEATSIRDVADAARSEIQPIDDVRASADYRRDSLATAVQRSLTALGRPPAGPTTQVTLSTRGSNVRLVSRSFDSTTPVETTVNGVKVTAAGAAGRTLLDWLRDEAGPASGSELTGTKEGCAEGECGACTVWLDGAAVMACLVPATSAAGAEVVTIEGLAEGPELHPLQQAFIDRGSVQCGFCIPGFLMAGAKLLEEVTTPTHAQTEVAFSGNLCRCTGYYRMFEAVDAAARVRR